MTSYKEANIDTSVTGSIPAWAGEPSKTNRGRCRIQVYPRVGGGTFRSFRGLGFGWGLSPRGRGNPRPGVTLQCSNGSIPAWAGEPLYIYLPFACCWVYPRVGGGTACRGLPPLTLAGLSPRGRGNQATIPLPHCKPGSIPAWAGEPYVILGPPLPTGSIPAWAGEPHTEAHPRVRLKVYPRVGGGTHENFPEGYDRLGLSPRGRGNHLGELVAVDAERSIPAWAGEPCCQWPTLLGLGVYPRVGGGTVALCCINATMAGLSPRGRGNLSSDLARAMIEGSIPAWAGEPKAGRCFAMQQRVYPRVGGGTVSSSHGRRRVPGLSPRGRGNRDGPARDIGIKRSIPAWAGEPSFRRPISGARRVYPRVGGGTESFVLRPSFFRGLSPRGRGNLTSNRWRGLRTGSIPAWAGEPGLERLADPRRKVYPRVGGGTLKRKEES